MMSIYPLCPLVLLLLSWYLCSWHVLFLHSFLRPAHIEFEALKSAGRYAMYNPVVQWPSVSLFLWAFERDTWKKHKYIYIYIIIYSQIYWQLGVLQIASGCHNNIWTLDSQSEAAFVVPQCVFFFVGCSQDRRKEGSSLGKGQVSFHGVWPKQKLWVQSEITDLVHLSFQKPEWNAKWDSHISMIWEYHHLVWNTKSCGLCRA